MPPGIGYGRHPRGSLATQGAPDEAQQYFSGEDKAAMAIFEELVAKGVPEDMARRQAQRRAKRSSRPSGGAGAAAGIALLTALLANQGGQQGGNGQSAPKGSKSAAAMVADMLPPSARQASQPAITQTPGGARRVNTGTASMVAAKDPGVEAMAKAAGAPAGKPAFGPDAAQAVNNLSATGPANASKIADPITTAAIMGGTQLVGGLISGADKSAEEAQKDQERMAKQDRIFNSIKSARDYYANKNSMYRNQLMLLSQR